MPEWMIVAVFYLAGVPVQADANLVDPARASTEEECRAVIPKYQALMREKFGVETVAECRRVPPSPPEVKGRPSDPASEVRS
jgi:hypothetical protein